MGTGTIQQSFEVYARLVQTTDPNALRTADRQLLRAANRDGDAKTLTHDEIGTAGPELRRIAPETRGPDRLQRVHAFVQRRIDQLLVHQFEQMVMTSDHPKTHTREFFDQWLKTTLPPMLRSRLGEQPRNTSRIQGAVRIGEALHVINIVITQPGSDDADHRYQFSIEGPTVQRSVYVARGRQYSQKAFGARYTNRRTILRESTTGTIREMAYTDRHGRTRRATLGPKSSLRDMIRYARLVSRFTIDIGLCKGSHMHEVQPPTHVRHMDPHMQVERFGPGIIYKDEGHGGATLASLIHQQTLRWDHQISGVTPRELYEGHRFALVLPDDTKTLPYMISPSAVSGWKNVDSYKCVLFMAKKVPRNQWHTPWVNTKGQSLTVHQVMARAATAYAAWDGTTQPDIKDHSYYHMPEILTTYLQDPTPVKDQFMQRELAGAIARLKASSDHDDDTDLSDVGHYTESLEMMVQSKKIRWSDHDRAQIKTWITCVRAYLRALPLRAINQEFAHLTKGLTLLEKHL